MNTQGLVPGPQRPFAGAAFDFHDWDCRRVVLNITGATDRCMAPRSSPSPSGPWTRSTSCRKLESRGSCAARSGAPGSLCKPRIWARTATPQPQRRSTGSLEKGPPASTYHKNCASRVVRPHPTPKAPPSFSWDHASGPETCILLPLGALEKMLGFPNVVVRESIGHRAGTNLVDGPPRT